MQEDSRQCGLLRPRERQSAQTRAKQGKRSRCARPASARARRTRSQSARGAQCDCSRRKRATCAGGRLGERRPRAPRGRLTAHLARQVQAHPRSARSLLTHASSPCARATAAQRDLLAVSRAPAKLRAARGAALGVGARLPRRAPACHLRCGPEHTASRCVLRAARLRLGRWASLRGSSKPVRARAHGEC